MNEPHKLDYAHFQSLRKGYSRFGIASVCVAAGAIIFGFVIGVLGNYGIDPFHSTGAEKQTTIASLAAIVGALLAVRAMQDVDRKKTLATLGLVLNILAFLAAITLTPTL